MVESDESGKFDGSKYFELCRQTADVIETFLKQKVSNIPIAKKEIISQSDTVARINIWKYLHCIDIYGIWLALSQIRESRNEDNNSNSNINDVKVDEAKCRRNVIALEHKIDLDVEIYKYKKSHHWKITNEKSKEIEKAFLERNDLEKSDLELDKFGDSKTQAKEKQQFKLKTRVEKQHKIMQYFHQT